MLSHDADDVDQLLDEKPRLFHKLAVVPPHFLAELIVHVLDRYVSAHSLQKENEALS